MSQKRIRLFFDLEHFFLYLGRKKFKMGFDRF